MLIQVGLKPEPWGLTVTLILVGYVVSISYLSLVCVSDVAGCSEREEVTLAETLC